MTELSLPPPLPQFSLSSLQFYVPEVVGVEEVEEEADAQAS